ncbi:MAG: UDP-2,3-diacylglucosamine diphosphatase [Bacteroidota bacterium]|nr:UDP-2,3-diacylglucosamine diphosphatase [Bacteroidota bacterium]
MEKVYFISDVHLGLGTFNEERKKEDRLIAFFDAIKKDATQIFIVGDLFDAWLEYRTVAPKGFYRTLAKLDELASHGIVIHYLGGNHDYWMRDYFSDQIGIRTYPKHIIMTINGKKIFIHHGDGLSDNDVGYKILKKILRNRFAIWAYSWLHPDIGIKLAHFSSRKSRGYSSNKHYDGNDGMGKFARETIDSGYNFIIMGHSHQPVTVQLNTGTYINLGDWITHNTYAEMNGEQITLKEWK